MILCLGTSLGMIAATVITTIFNILLGLGLVSYEGPLSVNRSIFTRSKFSVRMSISMPGGILSKSVTFVVCKHDLGSLERDLTRFSATQPFISLDCTIPLSTYFLIVGLPSTAHFIVVGIFGPSVAFTGPITRQAFSSLASTDDISGYQRLTTMLRAHLDQWTVRGPEPTYSIRHPMIAETRPRRPVDSVRRTGLKRPIGERAGRWNGMVGARGGMAGEKRATSIRDGKEGATMNTANGSGDMATTTDSISTTAGTISEKLTTQLPHNNDIPVKIGPPVRVPVKSRIPVPSKTAFKGQPHIVLNPRPDDAASPVRIGRPVRLKSRIPVPSKTTLKRQLPDLRPHVAIPVARSSPVRFPDTVHSRIAVNIHGSPVTPAARSVHPKPPKVARLVAAFSYSTPSMGHTLSPPWLPVSPIRTSPTTPSPSTSSASTPVSTASTPASEVFPDRSPIPSLPPPTMSLNVSFLGLGAIFSLSSVLYTPSHWRAWISIHREGTTLINHEELSYYSLRFRGRRVLGVRLLEVREQLPFLNAKFCGYGCRSDIGSMKNGYANGIE